MTVTHISAATGSLVWMVIEWVKVGRPSLVGIVTEHDFTMIARGLLEEKLAG